MCLCDKWKPSFLPLLIFDWRTFSRQVRALWWRQWVKNQVSTNQNSRNRWCLIVRRTICKRVLSIKFSCDHILMSCHISYNRTQQRKLKEFRHLNSLQRKIFKSLLYLIAWTLCFYNLPPLDIFQTSYLAEILHIWWHHKK